MKNNKFNLTLAMLAKMCNVSEGTVDRAIHNRNGINRETKEKILNVARMHGYIEKEKNNADLIGVVVFDVYNNYFSEFLMAFENECKKVGCSMVVMFTNKDKDVEYMCINQLYYMGVKGIVLCPCNEGEEFERFLSSIDIKIVTVGNRLNGFNYVGTDNFNAMYDATKVLKDKSKNIVYYSPALKSEGNKSAQQERYQGFVSCAGKYKIKYSVVENFEKLTALLDKDNSLAVLCSTDYYKIQVASKYPQCIVMGFDGLEELKKTIYCPMNVDTHIKTVAEESMKVILGKKNENIIVPYDIKST